MADTIKLRCKKCGNTMNYGRDIDQSLPPEVVSIETTLCDRCDDGGDFCTETWLDADGKEVVPEWARA